MGGGQGESEQTREREREREREGEGWRERWGGTETRRAVRKSNPTPEKAPQGLVNCSEKTRGCA